MKQALNNSATYLLGLLMILLAGCAGGDDNGKDPISMKGEPISLIISVPTDKTAQAASEEETRTGDPGSSTNETQDWDKIAIIVAYTQKTTNGDDTDDEPNKMVYWDVFPKSEFESNEKIEHNMTVLESTNSDNGTRTFTMYLPQGTVRAYGVTYSENITNGIGLIEKLEKIAKDGKDHNSEICALQISNNYADIKANSNQLGKFLSVATGYAINGNSTALTITKGNDELMKRWSMSLSRLATKLDIQWDTQGAYEKDYQNKDKIVYMDVRVSGFQYDGGATYEDENEASGYGRLFPFHPLQSSDAPLLGGKVNFNNDTEISRRNGRVCHYFFPDGSRELEEDNSKPQIVFHITGTYQDNDGTKQTRSTDYTLDFSKTSESGVTTSDILPLRPARWYKINANIKGVSQSSSVVSVGNP